MASGSLLLGIDVSTTGAKALLIDAEGRVTTVLDWDTAGAGHPLHDFDFGEWGFGLYRWEQEFPKFRQVVWDAYRSARGDAPLPSWEAVHLVFTISELGYFERRGRQGQLDEWGASRLVRLRRAIRSATQAVG